MEKPTKLEVFLFIFVITIMTLLGILFFQIAWMQVIWVGAIAVSVFYFTLRLLKTMELSEEERIRVTTQFAETTTKEVLETMPAGIVRFNKETHEVLWKNPFADYVFASNDIELEADKIKEIIEQSAGDEPIIKIGEKEYFVYLYDEKGLFYFIDITKEQSLKEEIRNRQLVIGTLSIDNYDDTIENMSEKEISILNSNITSIISDWMKEKKIYIRRLNAEKFIFVSRYKQLQSMMETKFDLLDHFRSSFAELGQSVTLSMGVSYGMSNTEFLGQLSNNNLEVALVRGGDQVVVKEDRETSKPMYFGGKSDSVVKRTRVRTRAMAVALKGIIQEVDEVYVMGHRFPDLDAIGASFGMSFLSKLFDKDTFIVLDESQFITDVKRTMEEIKAYPEIYDKIRSPQEVLKNRKKNSLLIMVDYNNPKLSISKKVYAEFEKIVVIDHHRRSEDYPENPLLSYIESGASSASELITELIQYQTNDKKRISRMEATLLMAGIVVDTKSFQSRTTSRTFDTASFLRNMGADNSKVQALLSSDLNSYMEMNELIANNEYITEDIVLGCGTEEKLVESVIQAKAADTLLSMNGIRASFVISKREDGKTSISARSKGEINVQTIMEKMGGGGHFNNAAVQKTDTTIQELKQELIQVVQANLDELYGK